MSKWFWAKAAAMLAAVAVRRQEILRSSVKPWIGLAASALLCAALLVASQPALAQFTQQGGKLVGTGADGAPSEGQSVAISADGNTAIVGGYSDSSNAGAAWVYTRSGGVWTPQGNKLFGTGASGAAFQGEGVALSADGNIAVVGGPGDNGNIGAVWVFTRSGGVWTQQGNKLVGNSFVGTSSKASRSRCPATATPSSRAGI